MSLVIAKQAAILYMQATSFPYQYPVKVVFHDLDAMRHVNNVVYLIYLESARIEFLNQMLGLETVESAPVILGDMYVRYHSPAVYPEELIVGLGISRFGTKSFDIVYQIDAETDGRTILTAKTTLVTFDYDQQRTIPIPAPFRATVEAFQQGWHFD